MILYAGEDWDVIVPFAEIWDWKIPFLFAGEECDVSAFAGEEYDVNACAGEEYELFPFTGPGIGSSDRCSTLNRVASTMFFM